MFPWPTEGKFMPIEFRCTQCQKLLRTQDDTAGKQAKCPICGTLVQIPEPGSPPPLPAEAVPPSMAATSPYGRNGRPSINRRHAA